MRNRWRRHPLYGDILRFCHAFIEGAWCRETASPGCQAGWRDLNPSLGQCAVTALCLEKNLREDYDIKVEILRTDVPGYGSHYWIRMPDGTEVDMTRDQFPAGTVIPPGEPRPVEQVAGRRGEPVRTIERFELLDKLVTASIERSLFEPLMKGLSKALIREISNAKPFDTTK